MIDRAAWGEYLNQRQLLREEFIDVRKRDGVTEAEKEAAWEKYNAAMVALRKRFQITWPTVERLGTHRFSLDEALRLAREAAPDVTINGRTAAELKIELSMEGKIK